MKHIIKLAVKTSLLSFTLFNASIASSEVHEAHVHGISDLTIAIDKNLIEINFTSPTVNLMGFEGSAKTKKQLKTIESTRKKLTQYKSLFSFIDASCVMAKSSLNWPDLSPKKSDDHHHGEHGHHHGHSHDHEIEARKHTDINAMYLYRCKNIDSLSGINVDLLDMFPATKQIHTQWITQNKQGAVTLNKKNKTVKF